MSSLFVLNLMAFELESWNLKQPAISARQQLEELRKLCWQLELDARIAPSSAVTSHKGPLKGPDLMTFQTKGCSYFLSASFGIKS